MPEDIALLLNPFDRFTFGNLLVDFLERFGGLARLERLGSRVVRVTVLADVQVRFVATGTPAVRFPALRFETVGPADEALDRLVDQWTDVFRETFLDVMYRAFGAGFTLADFDFTIATLSIEVARA